jgi:hypothetical protein
VTFADAVTIVGVAWSGTPSDYRSFVDRHGVTFITLDDTAGDIYSQFGVAGQPAWAFVSQDGSADVQLGGLSPEDFNARVQQLTTE